MGHLHLHLHLHQVGRLLKDIHLALHRHLAALQVAPSLYTASWLVTLFAATLPLSLVARVVEEAGEGEGGLEVQEVGKEVAKVVAEVPKGRLEVLEERVERLEREAEVSNRINIAILLTSSPPGEGRHHLQAPQAAAGTTDQVVSSESPTLYPRPSAGGEEGWVQVSPGGTATS